MPKPFHILKGSSPLIYEWGAQEPQWQMLSRRGIEGSPPFRPSTHRPLLRLCHHNPRAGVLLLRWAGDSMCELNSIARAARRNCCLFLVWWQRFWTFNVLSYSMYTFGFWEMLFKREESTAQGRLFFHIRCSCRAVVHNLLAVYP